MILPQSRSNKDYDYQLLPRLWIKLISTIVYYVLKIIPKWKDEINVPKIQNAIFEEIDFSAFRVSDQTGLSKHSFIYCFNDLEPILYNK